MIYFATDDDDDDDDDDDESRLTYRFNSSLITN
jgi:hypothetical protein